MTLRSDRRDRRVRLSACRRPPDDFRRGRRARPRSASEPFDVLVVGGGITGAGVALDAASRGLRTALVERDDFASGTSSKSSKLVHGGLRYLQQREFRLVYEALARAPARCCATRRTSCACSRSSSRCFSRDGAHQPEARRARSAARCGCTTSPAAPRIGKLHKRIVKEEALAHMPTLPADQLAASYLYYDAQADDARLTLTLARTAADARRGGRQPRGVVGLAQGRRRPGARRATVDADGEEIECARGRS